MNKYLFCFPTGGGIKKKKVVMKVYKRSKLG